MHDAIPTIHHPHSAVTISDRPRLAATRNCQQIAISTAPGAKSQTPAASTCNYKRLITKRFGDDAPMPEVWKLPIAWRHRRRWIWQTVVVEWYGVSSAESVPIAQSNIQRKNRFKESTEQDQQHHDVVNFWYHKALGLFKFLMCGCAKSALKTFSGKTQRIILWSVDSPQGSL